MRQKNGFAMIELLFVLVIAFFLIMCSIAVLKLKLLGLEKATRLVELTELRQYLRGAVECVEVLPMIGPVCRPGYFEIRGPAISGAVIVAGAPPYTVFADKYQLRASCRGGPSPMEIRFEFTLVNKDDWRDLYTDMPFLCEYKEGVREHLSTLPY